MKISNAITVPAIMIGLVSLAATGLPAGQKTGLYKNLTVLPKTISAKDLLGIMTDDFQDGLGVSCGFCHAKAKQGEGLDFGSDEKPEKGISRAMMRMTIGINRKFFNLKHPVLGTPGLVITCQTCHKGSPFPAEESPGK